MQSTEVNSTESAKLLKLATAIDRYTIALARDPKDKQASTQLETLLNGNSKATIVKAITLLPEERRGNLLEQCKDKATPLGHFTWTPKYALTKCSLEAGTLKEITCIQNDLYNRGKLTPLLHQDIFNNKIAPKLTTQEFLNLTSACKSLNLLFKKPLVVAVLLQHVAYGKQDKAEKMLKANPELALQKGKVTDYSFRSLNNISAVQYAALALDIHMLRMLLKGMSGEHKRQASQQLRELEVSGTEHGFNGGQLIQNLITALNTYVTNWVHWSDAQRDKHWIHIIGAAQRLLPTHVINEYCRPDRAFYPLPSFKESKLPRGCNFYHWPNSHARVLPLSQDSGLGFDFSLTHDQFSVFRDRTSLMNVAVVGLPRQDPKQPLKTVANNANALAVLCKVRNKELAEIKRQLQNPSQEPEQESSCVIS